MTRYFEDLEPGDVFETSGYTVKKNEIIEFAEQFDPQPFHVDEAAAEDSIFGGLIASGIHTMALASKLTVEETFDMIANLGGRGMDDLQFHQPVRPGDTLHVELEVLETTPSERHSERGYVTYEQRVLDDSDAVVLSLRMETIVRRRPEGQTE
ncbi:MaoC family dehydratase [Natronorubrum tibetense]|uniref:Acyl dehydratase MaoC n=1 Tax=Natronorubrum tibetense GA33 TaxID=1114856 RepID=L9VL22_9EURY|nr:MaoC family dehydratase [Natronorubrum tibetense]ELY37766.1 acyl dehydratase MaoC [Natronorubrum tibetense GA33]